MKWTGVVAKSVGDEAISKSLDRRSRLLRPPCTMTGEGSAFQRIEKFDLKRPNRID
ncbi:MAG: hypothetical protein AB1502_10550 [Thermodesulfobacteriota bacterium]